MQQLAYLGHELEEVRIFPRSPRRGAAAGRSGNNPGDPARAAVTSRQRALRGRPPRRSSASRRRRSSPSRPRSGAAPDSGARASSHRERRTARPSTGGRARTRARVQSRRAAASRPRAAADSGSRSPSARRARRISAIRAFPLRLVPLEELERERDVLGHGAPVVEHRGPGRRSRSRGRGGRCGAGLPVDERDGRPRAGSGRRSPRSKVDLPQPEGPISEMNSPCCDVQTDVLQRRDAARREGSSSPPGERRRPTPGGAHTSCSGGRCTTSFSATTTTRKNAIPRDRRHEVGGPEILRVEGRSTG